MYGLNNPRELCWLAILSTGKATTRVKIGTWTVKSQTGIGEYTVWIEHRKWECTCPNFEEYQNDSKHICVVKFSKKLKVITFCVVLCPCYLSNHWV